MIQNAPLVSIVMPAYNCESFIGATIESILNQSYSNFEFLIFNDGSTDGTLEAIKQYTDPRIQVFHSDTNNHMVLHLNEGMRIAKGKYIARMDADDIAFPERLQVQIQFLETHPEVGACGSWVERFGDNPGIIKRPESYSDIKMHLLFYTACVHPTMVYRKTIIDQYQLAYRQSYFLAEDYEFYIQLSEVTTIVNLPQALVAVRFHESSTSATQFDQQNQILYKIREEQAQKFLNRTLSDWETIFLAESVGFNRKNLIKSKAFYHDFCKKNKSDKIFPQKKLKRFLEQRIFYTLLTKPRMTFTYVKNIPLLFYFFPALLVQKYCLRYFAHIFIRNFFKLFGFKRVPDRLYLFLKKLSK